MNFIRSVKPYSRSLLCALAVALPSLSQAATVEVRLNDTILANASVEDSIWNGTLTTDSAGLLNVENGCIFLRYVDGNNNAFRSMETCGLDDAARVYRVNLSKEITLSGSAEYPNSGNALLIFYNLDEGRDITRGIGGGNPRTHSFLEKLPAGRYRIKVLSSSWPSPDGDYYLSSVGVDARGGSVSDITVGPKDATISRWPGKPPRADRKSVG